MRRRFSGTHGPYTSFQQAENAMRAQRINEMLDDGRKVFGDDGRLVPGTWHELEEAIEPLHLGISCKTKAGTIITIYAYDASEKRQ